MRSGSSLALAGDSHGIAGFFARLARRTIGVALLAATGAAAGALATWNVGDPSFSHATDAVVTNAVGYPGAVFSDLAMQFFGLASVAALAPALCWAVLLLAGSTVDRPWRRAAAWLGMALAAAGIAGCVAAPRTWPLPSGLGGVMGDMVLSIPGFFLGGYPQGAAGLVVALVLAAPALWLFLYAAGLIRRSQPFVPPRKAAEAIEDEDDDREGAAALVFGWLVHTWLSLRGSLRRTLGGARPTVGRTMRLPPLDEDDDLPEWPEPEARPVPQRAQRAAGARQEPRFADEPGFGDEDDDIDLDTMIVPTPQGGLRQPVLKPSSARVENPAPRPQQGVRAHREAQTSLISSLMTSGDFEMPTLHFLAEPKSVAKDASLSKESLEQNARLLEGVLEDFGVKGEIIHVRPGPVVTLYELEPAPGIKSSRVIGLADDIARSMSAIACRVAVVPGRNAIGIELPNARRETVYLRELLASRDFEQTKAKLALALGKTINGEAVIADIAKFPHLLVAGTTGSGKSVAINTFILSILYRMTPADCRLIMIDPKMLELSVYDGIPHLLTPVVTDPKKAVVALKWTVREMEDRYRKMSKVGVRNIDGFNQRVEAAAKKGEQLSRTVQTGFDRETGEAIYETENLDLSPMPYIVVIIDEMADLMMVAGKDIEGAVQRLAQMARAAGIHVIMATQRPSVDVITGTIKANFPTRISFQVTSKIDSRTILGEMGAEQLLGMGDMLYMAGGGRIQRVHGPFVSDEEVEKVVAHLKLQGAPEYLDAITEDDGDDEDDDDAPSPRRGGGGGDSFEDSDDPYDQAVSVVLRDGKASTSYIQRRLGVGYNKAASIIERMEKEGIVGPANHAGKREILVPTEGEDPF
jgi:S-DNA-T family DNA segregation ATPase FtsK/SpoIIIE